MRASRILSCVFVGSLFLAACGDDGDDGGGGAADDDAGGGGADDDVGDDDVGDDDVGDDDIGDDDIGDDDIGDDDIGDDDIGDDDIGDDDVDGGPDDDVDGGPDDDVDGGPDDDMDAGPDGGGGDDEPVDAGHACDLGHNTCDENAACSEPGDGGLVPLCDCNDGYLGDGTTCRLPESCLELAMGDPGLPNGEYTLAAGDGGAGATVYCEMTTAGGGWIEAFTEDSSWDPTSGSAGPGWTFPISITAEGSSMMIDFSDTEMTGPGDWAVRLIIEETADDVDPGLTLEQLFTDPQLVNFDLTANNRNGLTVFVPAVEVDPNASPDAGPVEAPDCAAVTAAWPGLGAAICGMTGSQHLVIQDSNTSGGETYSIGVSTANNAYGWPQAPDGQFPEYVRIWIR